MKYYHIKVFYSKEVSRWDDRLEEEDTFTYKYDKEVIVEAMFFADVRTKINKHFKGYKINKIEDLTIR